MDLNSILSALDYWAYACPNKESFLFLDSRNDIRASVTFLELHKNAIAVAHHINNLVPKNSVVLLLMHNDERFIYSFYGLLYSNSYPTIVNIHSREIKNHIDRIIDDVGSNYIITTRQIQKRFAARLSDDQYIFLYVDDFINNNSKIPNTELSKTDEIAFLQYTSGSTSSPKGIIISHDNLCANSINIQKHYEHTTKTIGLSWLPIHHDLGLVGGVLQPVFCGFSVYIMTPANFITKPSRWLEAISRYKVNTTSGPNFAYDLCVEKYEDNLTNDLDLSSWDVACIGGDMVHKDTLTAFAKRFAKNGFRETTFMPCYGMAESTLLVSGVKKQVSPAFMSISVIRQNNTDGYHLSKKTDFVSCGRPVGLDMKIVGHDDKELPSLHIGEIWLAGTSITRGFWNRGSDSEKTFNARTIGGAGRNYFRTGDLGFVDENGELYLAGRLKEIIILNGVNYSPSDIEKTAQSDNTKYLVTGRGAAFLDKENRLVLVQEIRCNKTNSINYDELANRIKTTVFQKNGLVLNELMFIQRGKVPVTSSGKVKRIFCKNIYPKLDGIASITTFL